MSYVIPSLWVWVEPVTYCLLVEYGTDSGHVAAESRFYSLSGRLGSLLVLRN